MQRGFATYLHPETTATSKQPDSIPFVGFSWPYFSWTDQDFGQLTRLILDLAQRADAPVLSVHGGGYNLPVTVNTAALHVEVLAEYIPSKN